MERFDLDRILIELAGSTSVKGNWTARHAVEGVQIFGGIGSGKTSGSGKMIALKYLEAGFGGLVLTVKPDEAALWQEYCKLAGRENDILIVGPGEGHYFNFLDYESKQSAANALTGNLVDVLKTVIRASADKEGGANEGFWESALDMLIYNIIDLCKLSGKDVSVSRMYELVQSLPTPQHTKGGDKFREMYKAARENVQKQIENWQTKQDIFEQQKHPDLYQQKQYSDVPDSRIMEYVDQFFCESLLNLAEKTRSIIDFSFSGFLFRLLREPVYSLFCANPTNFIPEDCLNGKVIILNLPVKIYQKAGRDCQIMFKYIWQRAMERRDITKNDRPVFLWADEAQNFLHEHDADYQATARSSRIATVYISQNLPNYYANMGSGSRSDNKVKSFLGTLNTKIFHANADIETNRYASELIGDIYYEESTRSTTVAGQFSASQNKSVKIDRAVRPEDFARLKTGGKSNDSRVEGYLHLQGTTLKEGIDTKNHTKVTFNQNYIPHDKIDTT